MNSVLTVLARFCAALPLGGFHIFSRLVGGFYGGIIRHRRAYVRETLAWCLPEKTAAERRRIARAMYRHLACNILELLRLIGGRRAEFTARLEVVGEEHVQAARAQGRGILILTAHLGNWDLLGILAAGRGYPLTIISKQIKHRGLNTFWMKLRTELGVSILPAKNSYRACLKILRANELLGFILDVNRSRKKGIFVDFFGRPACTTPGLAYLAAQSGAPVVPVFIRRLPDQRHRIEIGPALPPPPDREPEAIHAATQAYTRCIEEAIRRQPEQWLWLHKRWRTQPLPPDATGPSS